MAIIDKKPKLRAKVGNIALHFLDKDAFFRVCQDYYGKTITVTIDDSPQPVESDLFAFYFGIIIRKECMNSEAFSTYYDEKELHNIFQRKLRTGIRAKKGNHFRVEYQEFTDDVLQYDKKNFLQYLNDLKLYLESEFGIIIKNYEQYHMDKKRLTR